MKTTIKKWMLRLSATALLITGILLIIILNPVLTYANKTSVDSYTIYHNKMLDAALLVKLKETSELVKRSEFYHSGQRFDICLNDGSSYPTFMRTFRGQAFAWGFYNKVVLQGNMNVENNYVELNGYKWNLIQLLAHEITHCMQYNGLGFWKSKPVADVPNWKWEGYAEYISRKNNDQKDLIKNIRRLQTSDQTSWEITFEDGTMAPREYYNYWTLVQFCLDVKKITYKKLLEDKTSEDDIRKEMMKWYEENKNRTF